MFGRSRLKKDKVRKVTPWRRYAARFLVFLIIFTPLALLGYGAWFITHLPSLTIKEVSVRGGETVPPSAIETVVNEELNGAYYHFIPKRFAWFYPEEKIIEQIKNVPRVKDVTIEREGGKTLSISFSEYRPYALWCARISGNELGKCLFIDNEGMAFAAAQSLSGSALLRFIDEKKEPELRQQIFSPDWLKLGEEFTLGVSERFGFGVVYLERVNENEIFCHLKRGAVIKISSEKSAAATLDDLGALFADQQFAHLRSGNFVHIDLRYGNKVFVKETNATSTPEVSNEEMSGQ